MAGKTQFIDPSPHGNKTRSALGKGDPRIGVGGMIRGETINGFNSNPFKHGGAQEQRFADSDNKGQGGPTLGKAPKPEKVVSKTDTREEAHEGGGD